MIRGGGSLRKLGARAVSQKGPAAPEPRHRRERSQRDGGESSGLLDVTEGRSGVVGKIAEWRQQSTAREKAALLVGSQGDRRPGFDGRPPARVSKSAPYIWRSGWKAAERRAMPLPGSLRPPRPPSRARKSPHYDGGIIAPNDVSHRHFHLSSPAPALLLFEIKPVRKPL